MAKFSRRIHLVEAVQWFPGANLAGVEYGKISPTGPKCHFVETTFHGRLRIFGGDWIVTDVRGTNVMKDAEFRKDFDPVAG